LVVGLSVRERTEELERSSLSGWATKSAQSKGRERAELPDPIRTAFQVDRDRILNSAAFRRLQGKTHCFIPALDIDADPPFGTRLTHVLAVAQVARSVARGIRANEDLTEAIAFGASLGSTPYGYAGEEALAGMLDPPFRVVEQSLRIVEGLEGGGRGLNLSWEVRDGILHHSWSMPPAATVEGQIARLATRVVVVSHDLGDAVRAGMVSRDELPTEGVRVLGRTAEHRAATMIADLVRYGGSFPEPQFSAEVETAERELNLFLTRRVEGSPGVSAQRDRAKHVLQSLVVYLLEAPEQLPRSASGDGLEQRVVDHLSSLGDRAAGRLFTRFFMPGRPRRT
jgi:dGTPase